MATKKTKATPEIVDNDPWGVGAEAQGTATAPTPKTCADLKQDLHQLWDDLKALGNDSEASFMEVINVNLSGKSIEEVQAITAAAQTKAADVDATLSAPTPQAPDDGAVGNNIVKPGASS